MTTVTEFVDQYRDALMARDERRVAGLYAVPGLILFPGQAIAVSDERQTEEFFASAWGVTWNHVGAPPERLMYQFVETEDGWKLAVLTPA